MVFIQWKKQLLIMMMPDGIIVVSVGMGNVIHPNHVYGVGTTNAVSSGIVFPRVSIRSNVTKGQKNVMSKLNASI
jgi:hypothetical protein